jgi:hypothetical protein
VVRHRDLRPQAGPAGGRGRDVEPPVEGLHAVGEAAQARAVGGVRAAGAVVGDVHDERLAGQPHVDDAPVRAGVLADVRQALADDVVRRHLDRLGQPRQVADGEHERQR